MSSYDIQSYLFDRANIHDTITKMTLYLDTSRFANLATEVFADQMTVDYTTVLGGEPYEISGEKQAGIWKEMVGELDAWQHVTTQLLIRLSQPGPGVEVPDTVEVVANALVTMVKKGAEGGDEWRNGGRYILEVVRTEKEGNPWRVRKLRMDKVWESGNKGIISAVAKKMKE